MPYVKTIWTNMTGESTDSDNLNKIENELEYLDPSNSTGDSGRFLYGSAPITNMTGTFQEGTFYDQYE